MKKSIKSQKRIENVDVLLSYLIFFFNICCVFAPVSEAVIKSFLKQVNKTDCLLRY